MKTIQELIWEEIDSINKDKENLDPIGCSERLVSISVLHANLNKHIADLQNKYNFELSYELGKSEESFARIKAKLVGGDTHAELNIAEKLEKSITEIERSLKKYIRAKENEYQASSNL